MAQPCTGPHSCRISMWVPCLCGQGGAGPSPGQPCRQVLPVFLALLQQLPSAAWAPWHCQPEQSWSCMPQDMPVSSSRGAPVPDKASTSPSLCIWLPCLAVQSGVMQAASVQEQPLLKQNNLQKYRYSLCPRPDLAKEEQGSCPGQGLAQPHGAFGHRGFVHPTQGSQACSQPQGHSPPPYSKCCSHRQRFPPSSARSCPSPVLGQGTRWGGGCPR